jgi:membrane protein YqaA with SNARE-associated domain
VFGLIERIIGSAGYPGIVLLMLLENVLPPLPSELIMPMAGFVAASGELSLVGVILAGTLGSVAGALPWFYLGRLLAAGGSHDGRRNTVAGSRSPRSTSSASTRGSGSTAARRCSSVG